MKRVRIGGVGCILFSVLILMGCGSDNGEKEPAAVIPPGPGPGECLPNFDASGEFFTNMNTMESSIFEGISPHGNVQIWYSGNIQKLVRRGNFVVPEGTVACMKFDLDNDNNLDGIAVMIKQAATYDPPNNNWYYEMRDANGRILKESTPGNIANCIDCHKIWSSTDYLAGTLRGTIPEDLDDGAGPNLPQIK